MILLTTQTKEKKMDKENISADTLANYFDKPDNIEKWDSDLYDALIDVFVAHYVETEDSKLYQCHGCRKPTPIKRGDNTCKNCNTGIYWGTL